MANVPVSRGLALAEKHVQQSADERRANGDSQLADAVADAIEATLVTTADQREAALAPKQNHIDQLAEELLEIDGDGDDGDIWKWTETNLNKEETAEYDQRHENHRQYDQRHENHLEFLLGRHARQRSGPASELMASIYE